MGTRTRDLPYQTTASAQATGERVQAAMNSHYDPDRQARRSVEGRPDDIDLATIAVVATACSSFSDGGSDGGSDTSD